MNCILVFSWAGQKIAIQKKSLLAFNSQYENIYLRNTFVLQPPLELGEGSSLISNFTHTLSKSIIHASNNSTVIKHVVQHQSNKKIHKYLKSEVQKLLKTWPRLWNLIIFTNTPNMHTNHMAQIKHLRSSMCLW